MSNINHIHFIGIGGIGISALAYLALAEGKVVSGSDVDGSALLDDLKKAGAMIYRRHSEDHVGPQADRVVYSEAIDQEENPELLAARELGIPCLSYFEAVGDLTLQRKTIVVAGSHGKTTTTAMLGRALVADGFDPLVIVGSKVPDFGGRNIHIGQGEWFIVEGCEYRRSFLALRPFGLVLLNCEADHLDYYRDEADYVSAFRELAERVPREGFIVANTSDANVRKTIKGIRATVIEATEEEKVAFALKVPGAFNRFNALCALKAAAAAGANADIVTDSLGSFSGTWRRMEVKGEKGGVLWIDDYAHHPTEIRATLAALKEAYPGRRLICVFQPHQYSRTHALLEGFKGAFGDADRVIVPDIYEARDTARHKAAIDAERFARALRERHPDARYGAGPERTAEWLKTITRKGDLVVTMGAGNVWEVGERWLGVA